MCAINFYISQALDVVTIIMWLYFRKWKHSLASSLAMIRESPLIVSNRDLCYKHEINSPAPECWLKAATTRSLYRIVVSYTIFIVVS